MRKRKSAYIVMSHVMEHSVTNIVNKDINQKTKIMSEVTANEETIGVAHTFELIGFGKVIEALREGKMCYRLKWPTGTFVFRQVPSKVPQQFVAKMSSLPEDVKKELERRFTLGLNKDTEGNFYGDLEYNNQIAQVNAVNNITSWTPTIIDCFSNDWQIK